MCPSAHGALGGTGLCSVTLGGLGDVWSWWSSPRPCRWRVPVAQVCCPVTMPQKNQPARLRALATVPETSCPRLSCVGISQERTGQCQTGWLFTRS